MTHRLIERARALRPRLAEGARATEDARRLPAALSRAMGAEGFWRMLCPASLGGADVTPREWVEVVEALAEGDPAVGWIAVTSCSTSLLTAYLPEPAARRILGDDPEAALAGVFAPMGRATPVDGGYRLTGRWKFTSGCENARWLTGGALVHEGGGPRMLSIGHPEIRSFLFRAEDATIHDTWRTAGLRGTGSHDVEVDDVFVPEEETTCLLVDRPWCDDAVFAFPVFGLLAAGIAGTGLGMARAALDRVIAIAPAKKSRGGGKQLVESELVQVELARAEGELAAARAFLLGALDEASARVARGEALRDLDRGRIRLAAAHAATASAGVVDRAWRVAGGDAIWDDEPLSRLFRDVHVMTQHIMVGSEVLKPVGRLLFGLPTDTALL